MTTNLLSTARRLTTLCLPTIFCVPLLLGTESISTGTYNKQNSISVSENGSYIFLFGTSSSAYALCNTDGGGSDYVARSSEYTSLPNSITITNSNKELVWVVKNYNNGTFKLDGPNGYCYCSANAKLDANTTSSSTWEIGTASSKQYLRTGSSGYYVKNVSSNGFRAYNTTSNRTPLVAVYKLSASQTCVLLEVVYKTAKSLNTSNIRKVAKHLVNYISISKITCPFGLCAMERSQPLHSFIISSLSVAAQCITMQSVLTA